MTLRYLFRARFADGIEIIQTPSDASIANPGKSQYADVLAHKSELVRFSISNGLRTFSVFLDDGHFEMNGVRFHAGDPYAHVPDGTPFEVVYFRRMTQVRHANGSTEERCRYHLGHRRMVNGKPQTVTISVDNE